MTIGCTDSTDAADLNRSLLVPSGSARNEPGRCFVTTSGCPTNLTRRRYSIGVLITKHRHGSWWSGVSGATRTDPFRSVESVGSVHPLVIVARLVISARHDAEMQGRPT